MSAEVALGIGTAVAGLAGHAMNAAATSNLNYYNRKWQSEMWNKTNEYNTPVAQKERLEAAGINPFAVLGQGGADTGQAGSAGTPNTYSSPPIDGAGLFTAAVQNAVVNKQLRGLDLDNENKAIHNEFARDQELNKVQEGLEKIKNLMKDEDIKSEDYRSLVLQREYLENRMGFLVSQDQSDAKIRALEAQYKEQQIIDQHNESLLRQASLDAGVRVNNAQIAEMNQAIKESVSRINRMTVENKLTEAQVNTEIQKQATEVCNRVINRQQNQRGWNDMYVGITKTMFDMWNETRGLEVPFGKFKLAQSGATYDIFKGMNLPYNLPHSK